MTTFIHSFIHTRFQRSKWKDECEMRNSCDRLDRALQLLADAVLATQNNIDTSVKTRKALQLTYKDVTKAKAAQQTKEAQPPIVESTDTGATPTEQTPRKGRKGSGALLLKTLAMVRLGREIQASGKKGHDSLEDVLAARDLAHLQCMLD